VRFSGGSEDIGERLADNRLVFTRGDEFACLSEVGRVISLTPAEQTPKIGERFALGWKLSELAQDKTSDHAPVPDPNRRRQHNNDVCGIETWRQPLVVNSLNDPAVLADDGGQLPVALGQVGVNAVAPASVVPEQLVEIMGRDVKTPRELRRDV